MSRKIIYNENKAPKLLSELGGAQNVDPRSIWDGKSYVLPTDPKYDYVKAPVMDANDIVKMVPKLKGKDKLINSLIKMIGLDEVNNTHAAFCHTPGIPFTNNLLRSFDNKLRVDNLETLRDLAAQGKAFITVSNHPYGALDGIALISLVGKYRPDYKVMVNMILNKITAMRENFIAVDQSASKDPEKQKVSRAGIIEAMRWVKEGHVLGFFPAGAMSKWDKHLNLEDRPWRESVIRIIDKLQVPVLPIFFQGSNSILFNILGVVWWQARTIRLPREVFAQNGKEIHISIGDVISPEELRQHNSSVEELGQFLKDTTYSLRAKYKDSKESDYLNI